VGDMSRLRTIGAVEGDRVTVDAGARWSEVLAVTLAQGMTPPVLPEYVELSVGGTLAVGGVGATTTALGVQSDHVIELEAVTGTGETIVCSAQDDADLFDAVRAGLGQVGVITRATLELVAAPRSVRRLALFYPDLARMLNDQRRLAGDGGVDAVKGAIVAAPSGGFAFQLEIAMFSADDDALLDDLSDDPVRRHTETLAYADYVDRLAPLEAALRANGQWWFPHPWLTTFVGDSEVESVVDAELNGLHPASDLGPFGQVTLSPIRRSAIASPLLRMPADELCYAFNLIRLPATDARDEANRLVERNAATYERVRAAGGTLYPVSAFPLSRRGWREHFGPAFDRLAAAKRRFDPVNTLTPGYEIF
jgi:cytokinin dehydrogenase